MSKELTRVRVVDLVFDSKGNPVFDNHPDASRRKQKVNGGTYLYAGKVYRPGEVIEMPVDVARKELRISGQSDDAEGRGGRTPLLELFDDWDARQKAKPQQENIDDLRNSFQRKTEELQAQVTQAQKFRQLAEERERTVVQARDRDVAQAREEVPPTLAERLERLEALAEQERAARTKAEEELARFRREMETRKEPEPVKAPAAQTAPTGRRGNGG